jgi:hypothetical protein
MTLPQVSRSAAIWRRKSSGEPPVRCRPFSAKRRRTSGASSARLISAFQRATSAGAMPPGPKLAAT